MRNERSRPRHDRVKPARNPHFPDPSNLDQLDRYWRRSSFHDETIETVTALRRRVIIRLAGMTLVVTGATDLKRCDLPAVWLDETIERSDDRFTLDVETESGRLVVVGEDIRLLRNDDLAMLIPAVDA